MFITLKPLGKGRPPRPGDRALEQGAAAGLGHHLVYAGGAGHHDRARLSKTSTSIRSSMSTATSSTTGHNPAAENASMPQLTDVASDQQTTAGHEDRVNRQVARSWDQPSVVDSILYDAFGQRVAARLYTQVNQYFVILRSPTRLSARPNALSRIYATCQRDPGTAEPVRYDHLDSCTTFAANQASFRR